MKFGCVCVPKDIGLLAAAGYDYMEFSGRAVCALSEKEFFHLRGMVAGAAIPCLGLNAYCPPEVIIAGPGYARETIREYARLCAARASALGVTVIGIGSPRSRTLPDGYDRTLAFAQAVEFFGVTADVFAPYGITVCAEALGPCYCNFLNTLNETWLVVNADGRGNLHLVLDFYNMEHSGEADIALAPYAAKIAHAHISDDAGSPTRRWFLKEEKRELHITRLRKLYAAGFSGNVTVEIDLPVDPAEATRTLSILRASAA
jgi:sugar phosphate isomerase/epimerase